MPTEVSCPYCIAAGFSFRRMVRNTLHEYVCPNCGHVEHPEAEASHCHCVHCQHKMTLADVKLQVQTAR